MAQDEIGEFIARQMREHEEGRRVARERMGVVENQIGERLRAARGDVPRRVVVDALADEGVVMQGSTLADIEAGRRGVRLSEALVLAQVYGVDISTFVHDVPTASEVERARLRRDELRRMRDYLDGREEQLRYELEG